MYDIRVSLLPTLYRLGSKTTLFFKPIIYFFFVNELKKT